VAGPAVLTARDRERVLVSSRWPLLRWRWGSARIPRSFPWWMRWLFSGAALSGCQAAGVGDELHSHAGPRSCVHGRLHGLADPEPQLRSHGRYSTSAEYTLTGAGNPDRLRGAQVTASFLPLLGVAPKLGRNFLAEEDQPSGPKAVILKRCYLEVALWSRSSGGRTRDCVRWLAVHGGGRATSGLRVSGQYPGGYAGSLPTCGQ